MNKLLAVALTIFMLLPAALLAQEYKISGRVIDERGEPIYFAIIHLKDANRQVYADENGLFTIKVPVGKGTLIFSSMGFAPQEVNLEVNQDRALKEVVLKQLSLSLDEVTVVAKAVDNKSGTSVYEIGEQAIKQVQAMSLADVLTLLPGKKVLPSNMNSVMQPDLRSAVTSTTNNFGTSVVLDGATVNNDGNMQAFNPASSLAAGKGVTGRGVDLRSITTGGIEKVEVISGIASPKYGDLTSGAIIVTSKVGRSPLMASANLNPTSYQISLNKGVQLGAKGGFLNSDLSYTHAYGSPTVDKEYTLSLSGALRWKVQINRELEWTNTTSLQINTLNNNQKIDPDESFINLSTIRDQRYSVAVNGSLKLLGSLHYSFNGSVDKQYSHSLRRENDGPFPLLSGLESGTSFTTFSPISYEQEIEIRGLPLNFGGRVEATQDRDIGNYKLSFNTGMQYSYVKNYGSGRVMLGNVVGSYGATSSRDAKFHEIPASKTLSGYHESNIRRVTERSRRELRLGLRYDYMNERYHLFSPRFSYSTLYFNRLKLRASWGLSYKAPAMIQLYPGPLYLDFHNLIYYANNPAERLAIVTTEVIQPTNDHLKPSRGETKEIGVDWEGERWQVRSTLFYKTLSNGIHHTQELFMTYKQNYRIVDKPVGRQPIVEPIAGDITPVLRGIGVIKNNYSSNTTGVELMVNPPKIERTNTEFDLKLTYLLTEEIDHGYKLTGNQFSIAGQESRFGVYENPRVITKYGSGNLSVIQHIPSLRLIFNLVVELNFVNYSDRSEGSLYPYAYYSADGTLHQIPQEKIGSAEFASLKLPDSTYETIIKPPFYTNYHLNVRKETKDGHSFSFFANNALWYNPFYYRKEVGRELNGVIAFGFGMTFKIGN